MNRSKILPYVEGAVIIAMAAVLGMIRIFKLPWGGSVTLVSMLPVSLYSIKYGVKKGLGVAFVFSIFQFFQGITDGLFAWGLNTTALLSCIFLDYILAYTAVGIAGIFRKKGSAGWITGTVTALMVRFMCHFVSGAVIFKSAGKLWDGFQTQNTFLYSLLYNGSYMLPEIIFTCVGSIIIFRVPAMHRLIVKNEKIHLNQNETKSV